MEFVTSSSWEEVVTVSSRADLEPGFVGLGFLAMAEIERDLGDDCAGLREVAGRVVGRDWRMWTFGVCGREGLWLMNARAAAMISAGLDCRSSFE